MFSPQNTSNNQNKLIHGDIPNNSNPSSPNNWFQHPDPIFSVAHKQIGGNESPFHRLSPPSNPSKDRPHPWGRVPRGPLSPSARCSSRLRNVVVRGRCLSGQSHARGLHAVCLCCEEVLLVTGPKLPPVRVRTRISWSPRVLVLTLRLLVFDSGFWCWLFGCWCGDVTPSVWLLDLVSGWY